MGAAFAWRYESIIGPLEGTEFGGGRLTGPLLTLYDVGALLFVLALLLVFFYRRIAAAITILASLLCMPIYFYFTAPGLSRRVFQGPWAEPLQTSFVWNGWPIAGILTHAVVAYVSFSSLLVSGERKHQNFA